MFPKIRGKTPPKSSHLFIGFSILFTIHFGGPPLFLETPISKDGLEKGSLVLNVFIFGGFQFNFKGKIVHVLQQICEKNIHRCIQHVCMPIWFLWGFVQDDAWKMRWLIRNGDFGWDVMWRRCILLTLALALGVLSVLLVPRGPRVQLRAVQRTDAAVSSEAGGRWGEVNREDVDSWNYPEAFFFASKKSWFRGPNLSFQDGSVLLLK